MIVLQCVYTRLILQLYYGRSGPTGYRGTETSFVTTRRRPQMDRSWVFVHPPGTASNTDAARRTWTFENGVFALADGRQLYSNHESWSGPDVLW